jgi:hypothetical protein
VTGARYVYCLVDPAGNDGGDADPDRLAGTTGLDDAPVRLVGGGDDAAGVGAVVHDCESVYDTDDEARLRRWLLAHQRVVDAATEAFGAPLPVRFDTVIDGDDDAVVGWLASVADAVREGLASVAGCREYRVCVHWTADADDFEARARESDARLADLADERDAASEGRGFLVGKQYDARLRELRRARIGELDDAAREAVAGVARSVDAGDPDELDADDGVPVASLSVLAPVDDEERLGDRLDDYVDAHPVTVRFTGPWAPYSFAPEVG